MSEPEQAGLSGGQPVYLIGCAHGTNNADGQQRINRLREQVQALLPNVRVLEAYVDVQEPALPDVVAGLPAGARAVVVPLLLSVGYHVRVDIAQAVASRAGTRAAEPLGPDPRLAQALHDRIGELPEEWAIVLAAAGSSDPTASLSVEALAADLRKLRANTVVPAYGASAKPSVPDAVAQLRSGAHGHVAIASFLLAPGYFHDQLAKAGADTVSEPLLPSGVLAQIAVDRFNAVSF